MNHHDKLERAWFHLKAFDRAVNKFIDDDPYDEVRHHDPHPNPNSEIIRFDFRKKRDLPKSLPFIVGEAVYNMRSSLDHLAFELSAQRVGRETAEKAQSMFPIHSAIGSYMDSGVRACRNMSQAVQDIIEAMQPYNGPKPIDRHPLAVLNALSNIDKHRHFAFNGVVTLQGTNFRVESNADAIVTGTSGGIQHGPFEDMTNALTLTVEKVGPNPQVKIDANFTIDPTFPKTGPAAGKVVLTELGRIFVHINQEVFPKLDPLLGLPATVRTDWDSVDWDAFYA